MLKNTVVLGLLTALLFVLLSAGCGVKGPPQPPEPEKQALLDSG